ncbi:hypothetical protein ACIBQ1_30820 [Nonomuraea sp. NPDC050153]|uniref:hypothetical protein n=1 Tax=Nonomuraea sp. NPDC050153 TaxID=3364359 RepID=UPI00378B80C2
MPAFERLTIEEARALTRAGLLPRVEEEQKYWYQRIHRCRMQLGDDEAFRTFNRILHVTADLTRTHDDTEALLRSRSLDEDYWRKPLGELVLL